MVVECTIGELVRLSDAIREDFFFFLNWGCGGHPAGASSIENYIICGNQM